ncbi:hypothetical protein MPER_02218, partial [Moniliophthora perniciosa FA553]
AATAATVATQAAATTHAGNTTAAAAYVPLNPLGDIVAAQAPFGNSFLFYQSSTNGDIMMARVSNAFSDGSTSFAGAVVPRNEVLWGTPIAVAQQQEDGNDDVLTDQSFKARPILLLSQLHPERVPLSWLAFSALDGGPDVRLMRDHEELQGSKRKQSFVCDGQ